MFNDIPFGIFEWSTLATDLKTAVGPRFSVQLAGDSELDTGLPAFRPTGVAPR